MSKAGYAPNVLASPGEAAIDAAIDRAEHNVAGNPVLATVLGASMAIGFYGVVYATAWGPLQRYFLGHPVAVAATVLFCFAVAVLIAKWLGVVAQSNQLGAIRDEDLVPPEGESTPAKRWLQQNDAGHVARQWLAEIARLPSETLKSHLVVRLRELLTRQSQRGSTKHLADDLRELSARDADAAHDSLGLVRIIIWAIPMLGFLGTVIGITQTLGGLDFSNGSAAVQNLKGGLYVAFDTTALGLVMSVAAIFLQFPIERGEQRLLAAIDARVGHLVSASLPSDETSDNQTALIADLCRGVQAAVAESLENQARLWRDTIDEAQSHWQSVHEDNHNKIAEAFEQTLVPALSQHADRLTESSTLAGDRLGGQCDRWQATLDEAQELVRKANAETASSVVDGLKNVLRPALLGHAQALDESTQTAVDRMEHQGQQWQQAIGNHSEAVASQQKSLMAQYEMLSELHDRADSVVALQQVLDANLKRLSETNAAIDRSVSAAASDGMAEAMRFLARAVDVLAKRLPEPGHDREQASRRAA
jgi:biopolymer transport protein ExbB/TolQ